MTAKPKVSDLTLDEMRHMIEDVLEAKLSELLGDPDEGLEIRKSVRDRLLRQKRATARGERGVPLSVVRDSLKHS